MTSTPSTQAGTIVVIDDDVTSLELMSRSLSRLGVRVLTATTGEEGLRLARESRPLAIFLDVIMPNMDGWAVLSRMKADPDLAGIPVVMATMLDERKKALDLGVSDYLLKPIERSRLAALLETLAQAHGGATPPPPAGVKSPPLAEPIRAAPAGGVLIVEDDATNREILARLLRKRGLAVVEAGDGQTALRLMEQATPSLILLDIMLPTMDGITFVKELRKTPDYRAIPIVVLTAKDLSLSERQQLGDSVRRVFQKGVVKREELLREISVHQATA